MRAFLTYFMLPDDDGETGDERAAKLTLDAWKRGVMPADLWAMPVHQLLFCWFKQPEEMPADAVAAVTAGNQGQVRPFVPGWMFEGFRRSYAHVSARTRTG